MTRGGLTDLRHRTPERGVVFVDRVGRVGREMTAVGGIERISSRFEPLTAFAGWKTVARRRRSIERFRRDLNFVRALDHLVGGTDIAGDERGRAAEWRLPQRRQVRGVEARA